MTTQNSAQNVDTESFAGGKLGDVRALVVWAALIVATVASYLLGAEHAVENAKVVTAFVIAVALIKVRLVAMHFMEISRAPLPLRLVFEAYGPVMFVVLFVLYLAA